MPSRLLVSAPVGHGPRASRGTTSAGSSKGIPRRRPLAASAVERHPGDWMTAFATRRTVLAVLILGSIIGCTDRGPDGAGQVGGSGQSAVPRSEQQTVSRCLTTIKPGTSRLQLLAPSADVVAVELCGVGAAGGRPRDVHLVPSDEHYDSLVASLRLPNNKNGKACTLPFYDLPSVAVVLRDRSVQRPGLPGNNCGPRREVIDAFSAVR